MALFKSLSLALCLIAGASARRSMHEIQVSKQLQLFNEDVYKVSALSGSKLKLETTTAALPRIYWENVSVCVVLSTCNMFVYADGAGDSYLLITAGSIPGTSPIATGSWISIMSQEARYSAGFDRS
jgi:hypothetical protein